MEDKKPVMLENPIFETTVYVRPEKIARFVGITTRRVQQLTQDGIIQSLPPPEGGPGRRYDFMPTIQCLLTHYRERAERKTAPDIAMEEEKLRRETAKRKLDEIKLATVKAQLHRTQDIERVFGAMLSRLRVGLMALPQGVAPLLTDETDINMIAGIITERISRSLNELITFDFSTFAADAHDYISELAELDEPEETDELLETEGFEEGRQR